jgi:dye decolorizing peroxidase
MTDQRRRRATLSRRSLLAATSLAGVAAAAGAVGGESAATALRGDQVTTLLRRWSKDARRLTAGEPPQDDDAMATGYGPSSLTITLGFGASSLRTLGAAVPGELEALPAFPGDHLDKGRSDGDLGLLFTADDATVVAHALRSLSRSARGTASVRWQMSGFSAADGVSVEQGATPRNLMGQLDGTGNPRPGDPGFDAHVFVGPGRAPAWMRGGSYLVFRRIRMLLDRWDDIPRQQQESIVGRRKDTGAPLSGGTEFTPFDLDRQNPDGGLAIGPGAHVRQASPASNSGATILRRGFSYYDGYRADGAPDAGLLFMAFQSDPRDGFTRIQQRLALADELSRFLSHESSALFAVPPGSAPGGYLGQGLMESL